MKTQKLLLALLTTTAFMATSCSKPTYTVTFDTKGGSKIADVKVDGNKTIERPTNPFNRPYAFCGWYLDEDYKEAFDFDTPIVKNTTLYAKWDSSVKFTYTYHNEKADENTIGLNVDWLSYDPLSATYCDLVVDWGDDSKKEVYKAEDAPKSEDLHTETLFHTYTKGTSDETTYTVTIQGLVNGLAFTFKGLLNSGARVIDPYKEGNRFVQSVEINELLYNSLGYTLRLGCYNDNKEISEVSSVTLPEDLIAISQGGLALTSIKSFAISDKINEISRGAFAGDIKLEAIDFTNASSLYSIREGAFTGCVSLKEICLPSNLSIIGNSAFYGCNDLKTITFTSYLPPVIGSKSLPLSEDSKLEKVYVPKGRLNDYSFAWRDNPDLVELLVELE